MLKSPHGNSLSGGAAGNLGEANVRQITRSIIASCFVLSCAYVSSASSANIPVKWNPNLIIKHAGLTEGWVVMPWKHGAGELSQGKVTIVELFHSGCAPSLKTLRYLSELAAAYSDQVKVTLLTAEPITNLVWFIEHDLERWAQEGGDDLIFVWDPELETQSQFPKCRTYPQTYILDGQSRIVYQGAGPYEAGEKLDQLLGLDRSSFRINGMAEEAMLGEPDKQLVKNFLRSQERPTLSTNEVHRLLHNEENEAELNFATLLTSLIDRRLSPSGIQAALENEKFVAYCEAQVVPLRVAAKTAQLFWQGPMAGRMPSPLSAAGAKKAKSSEKKKPDMLEVYNGIVDAHQVRVADDGSMEAVSFGGKMLTRDELPTFVFRRYMLTVAADLVAQQEPHQFKLWHIVDEAILLARQDYIMTALEFKLISMEELLGGEPESVEVITVARPYDELDPDAMEFWNRQKKLDLLREEFIEAEKAEREKLKQERAEGKLVGEVN